MIEKVKKQGKVKTKSQGVWRLAPAFVEVTVQKLVGGTERSVFDKNLYKPTDLDCFRIKFLKVGTCQNCLSLVDICSW